MSTNEIQFGHINKIVLFGGGEVLFNIARSLQEEGVQVLVVTSSRHAAEFLDTGIILESALRSINISVLVSRDINIDEFVHKEITTSTLGISFGAAWIFKSSFISRFKGRLINSHGTRLPQYRGGGGFSWQIMNKNYTGFTLLHIINDGVDTGEIVAYQEFFYPTDCRIPANFQSIYNSKNIAFIKNFIKNVLSGVKFTLLSQQDYFSQYWPRLATDIHGWIDWNWSLIDIESFICAFDHPYHGASTFINNKRVRLKNCFIDMNDGVFHPFQKGIIYRIRNHAAFIATEKGTLIVQSIAIENDSDYFNFIQVGDRLYTPVQYLEEAKLFRAVYTSVGLKD